MGKLGYRKSRNGCANCKKRRVKCDEQRPCTACVRHQVVCSLQQGQQSTRTQLHPTGDTATPTSSVSSDTNQPTPIQVTTGSASDDWITDLELLHWWTTVASCTHPVSPTRTRILQEDVPRLAFNAPYLLHQILAMSALHINWTRNETSKKYILRSSHHQAQAITLLRQELSRGVTAENGYMLYLTSGMLMASTFASHLHHHKDDEPGSWLTALLEIMSLVRGMTLVRELANGRHQDHPPFELVGPTRESNTGVFSHPELTKRLEIFEDAALNAVDLDPGYRDTIVSGIKCLLECMAPLDGPNVMKSPDIRVVFRWLHNMPEGFAHLVHMRDEGALVVLLHFCVVLQIVGPQCWFFRGWGINLAESMCSSLGETRWRSLVDWPLDEIRERAAHEAESTDDE